MGLMAAKGYSSVSHLARTRSLETLTVRMASLISPTQAESAMEGHQAIFKPDSVQPLPRPSPLIKGVELKKHYKTSGFGQSTPLIKGVSLHPPN